MTVPYSSQKPLSLGQLNNVQIDTSTLVNDEVIAFNSASNTWKNVNAGTTHNHNEISQLDSNVTVTDTGANGLISFTTDGVLEASINGTNGLNLVTSKLTVNGVDGNAGDVLTSDGTNVSWVAPTHPLPTNEISQLDSSVIVTDTGSNGLVNFTIDGTVEASINSAGLGVGITPVEVLDLKTNPYTGDCRIRLDAPTNFDTEIKFYNNGLSQYAIGHDDATDNFVIGTTNVDAPLVSVTKTGSVGIGTSTPTSRLHVLDETNITPNASSEGHIQISGLGYAGCIALDATGMWLSHNSASRSLILATDETERMRINESGNVMIGTTSAALSGTSAGHVFHADGNGSTVSASGIHYYRRTSSDGVFMKFRSTTNATVGQIEGDGTNTTYATSSDYRLKENVDYKWDATTRLKQLKPCRFNFIADDKKVLQDGFLAHEVSDVVPKAVTGTKDGEETQGIDHSKLVPLLVKTIQELTARIEVLESV